MTTIERVEEAVSSAEDIRWLRGYLQGQLDAGVRPELLEDACKHAHERLVHLGREDAADAVLDALDLLTGWHGPGMGVRIPGRA
jgi:hypothetical protein